MSMPWNAAYCTTCAETGRRGYCAPAGCYCGHEACHAFASYVHPKAISATNIPTTKSRAAELWADREEPTWLDR